MLVGRFGDRVLVGALLVFAIPIALAGLVEPVLALAAVLVVLGAASGAVDVAMTARVVALQVASYLGYLVSPFFVGGIADAVGLRTCLVAVACVSVVLATLPPSAGPPTAARAATGVLNAADRRSTSAASGRRRLC